MIRCVSFRRFEKNTLCGFADLELTRVGLVLHGCTWHRHPDGKESVGFPARPYQDTDRNTQWQPLIEFAPGARRARGIPQAGTRSHRCRRRRARSGGGIMTPGWASFRSCTASRPAIARWTRATGAAAAGPDRSPRPYLADARQAGDLDHRQERHDSGIERRLANILSSDRTPCAGAAGR